MKPPTFSYHVPTSLEEALNLLEEYGDDAKVLAGGQSLMPLLNFRLAYPAALIDINRIRCLSYIKTDPNEIRIGALTRQRTLEFSDLVRRELPLLHAATKLIGHLPIRTRGTLGGSLCHADPAAEYPAAAVALDAQLIVESPRGRRSLGADEFFQNYLTTALGPNDILTEVRFPRRPLTCGWAFEEFARRHGDFAIVGVAAIVDTAAARRPLIRIAWAGIGPTPVRLREVENILRDTGLSEAGIREASQKGLASINPDSDIHGSSEFRRHLALHLTRRAIHSALQAGKENLA